MEHVDPVTRELVPPLPEIPGGDQDGGYYDEAGSPISRLSEKTS
jgi:hypothetical protein